jgi:hypothetical protein
MRTPVPIPGRTIVSSVAGAFASDHDHFSCPGPGPPDRIGSPRVSIAIRQFASGGHGELGGTATTENRRGRTRESERPRPYGAPWLVAQCMNEQVVRQHTALL